MPRSRKQPPKHDVLYRALERDILEGKFRPGQKLPSEAALVKRFGISRITAGRAVRDLQEIGLVERRAGSGTYVSAKAESKPGGLTFGLLIPNLGETEIFEPICRGIAGSGQAEGHALLWGNVEQGRPDLENQSRQLCRQYIARKVAGVFFAPLESTPFAAAVNLQILEELEAARIPIVLLDRCVLPYPDRSAHDLAGIDNRRAGYIVTSHLAKLGCRRIAFAAYANSASTVAARIAGYREALFVHGCVLDRGLVASLNPDAEETQIGALMAKHKPEALVCANDRTAGRVMLALSTLGFGIPQDVRIAGIDDVAYASLLSVPLTTVRQPVREIGETALAAMLERIERPAMPVRDLLLGCQLVIRRSCGAK